MSSENDNKPEENTTQENTETSESTEKSTISKVETQPIDPDDTADEIILWGTGRAAAIALAPIPLADIGPLMANEAYMIYRIADNYDCKIDDSVVAMLLGVSGGSILGKITASFLPFLKVPIAAGITYAIGKTAKAYFNSGMILSEKDIKIIFDKNHEKTRDFNLQELLNNLFNVNQNKTKDITGNEQQPNASL